MNISISTNIGKGSRPTVNVSNIRGKFPHCEVDSFHVLVDGGTIVGGNNLTFSSEELAALGAWIELNAAVLLEAWCSDTMDSADLISRLAALGSA